MRRVERMSETAFGIENSTVDPNRFYSILLDARAASVSDNMCDIAEKLLQGEKDNAKGALEQLWRLKKNLFSGKNDTIDLLITYYQEKMDVLRGREEHLRKVSRDSRSLLEDKRQKDEEVATVKQQVSDCTKELTALTEKLNKLKIKEQELTLIDHQLREELNRNENEIVNGLYEIILTPEEENVDVEEEESVAVADDAQNKDAQPIPVVEALEQPPVEITPTEAEVEPVESLPEQPDTKTITAVFEPPLLLQASEDAEGAVGSVSSNSSSHHKKEPPPFPRSVVKTAGGKIIGEYYYDGKVYKNERVYIMNTLFFAEELLNYTKQLKLKFDLSTYTELLQMVQDVLKRTADNKRLHFEVATNEILNVKSTKRLWQDAKLRSIDEIERFGVRLRAKIDALGSNYITMLKEQMQRCGEKS